VKNAEICYLEFRRYFHMADDKSKKGPQDRDRISITEEYEVRYWSKKFGVTPDQLRATVRKVGNTVATVERELKRAA
jgi:Protein of unknown function (DUF3606)